MANYAGETYRIWTRAVDLDEETPLTNTEVDTVTVTIFDSEDVVFLPETVMSWSASLEYWYYDWQTGGATPIPAGKYKAKCHIKGVLFESWEYKDIRLKANPV